MEGLTNTFKDNDFENAEYSCECNDGNIIETVEHIIRDCPKYGETRRYLAEKVNTMELKDIMGIKKGLDELVTFLEH